MRGPGLGPADMSGPMARNLVTAVILRGLIVALVLASRRSASGSTTASPSSSASRWCWCSACRLFMGNSGILSFAHIGFMGVGAYTSAVLTIPVQMKGMALPDLYPFLQGVELSPYLGNRSRRARRRGGRGRGVLSADAAIRCGGGDHLLRLLVVLYTVMTNWSEMTNGPRTLFGLPKATTLPLAARWRSLALIVALAFKESRTGRPAAREPRRRGRRRLARRARSGAALARLHPRGAARRHRRGAVGAFHHVLLAESLLSQGDVPDPGDAGDRRRRTP